MMEGYYKDRQATEEAVKNRWFYTGDLARVDQEGYFYIVDRKKDIIVSGGENIYPGEIEEILFKHPGIEDAAIVGVPDPLWGEKVMVFIVKKEGEAIVEQEVINYCKKYLAGYKIPRIVEFIHSIPKNPSGKPLKRLLKQKNLERKNPSE